MATALHGMATVLLLSSLAAWALLNAAVCEGPWNIPDADDCTGGGQVLAALVVICDGKAKQACTLKKGLEGKLCPVYL